jgi:septum formation protein
MPLWLAADPLVLASKSSVRRALLTAAGVSIEVCPADLDERATEASSTSQQPDAIAALLAREKARLVERRHAGRLVLGADQVLVLDGQRLTKPADRAVAREQLQALSGRSHELHSAVAFAQNGNVLFESVRVARLTMRRFSEHFLERYLAAAGDAATRSVGAYQIESLGIQLFERVDGDYFTVLGLPLFDVLAFLRRHGCLLP